MKRNLIENPTTYPLRMCLKYIQNNLRGSGSFPIERCILRCNTTYLVYYNIFSYKLSRKIYVDAGLPVRFLMSVGYPFRIG